MTMRDRVRRWLGLGLDDFYAYSKLANVELARGISECSTKNLIAASEKAQRERHGELIERLAKLEQNFISQHVGSRSASVPVYDWEQVQAQELAEMMANRPKEEN